MVFELWKERILTLVRCYRRMSFFNKESTKSTLGFIHDDLIYKIVRYLNQILNKENSNFHSFKDQLEKEKQ